MKKWKGVDAINVQQQTDQRLDTNLKHEPNSCSKQNGYCYMHEIKHNGVKRESIPTISSVRAINCKINCSEELSSLPRF